MFRRKGVGIGFLVFLAAVQFEAAPQVILS